jgi:gas vesicle protein
MSLIYGNVVGGIIGYGKTFVLTDESGNELTGVIVDEEVIFTANDEDVRQGKVYAGDSGVSTGTLQVD